MGEQIVGRVNSGLGMGAEPGMELYQKILSLYDNMAFSFSENSSKQVTVVQHVTDLLLENGYVPNEGFIQNICGINIYPSDYFNPQNYETGAITITGNTRTIHHFAESWKPPIERWLHNLKIRMSKKSGTTGEKIAYLIGMPYWFYRKFKNSGMTGVIHSIQRKLHGEKQ